MTQPWHQAAPRASGIPLCGHLQPWPPRHRPRVQARSIPQSHPPRVWATKLSLLPAPVSSPHHRHHAWKLSQLPWLPSGSESLRPPPQVLVFQSVRGGTSSEGWGHPRQYHTASMSDHGESLLSHSCALSTHSDAGLKVTDTTLPLRIYGENRKESFYLTLRSGWVTHFLSCRFPNAVFVWSNTHSKLPLVFPSVCKRPETGWTLTHTRSLAGQSPARPEFTLPTPCLEHGSQELFT